MISLRLLLLAATATVNAQQWPGAQGSVKVVDGVAQFTSGIDTTADAWGSYDPVANNHPSGFAILKVQTSAASDAKTQYYAAGYLESVLTAQDIYYMYENIISTWPILKNGPPGNMSAFLTTQAQWMADQIVAHPQDPYWQQVALFSAQYQGLIDGYGYRQNTTNPLTPFAFFVLNGVGDLFDLIPRTTAQGRPNFKNMTKDEIDRYLRQNNHCSALVKLTGDYSDLFMGHSSWFRYQSMLRIMKNYNFPGGPGAAKKVTFSSYPGFLESLDDFYIMDSGLVMLQTTNSYFNDSLLQNIIPESLFAFQRVRIASALARDGREWQEIVGRHNSGTYTNQYMVINLNLFKPKQPLVEGLLYVGEQLPGYYYYYDYTNILSRGYWPSYNVPAIPEIYALAGYPDFVRQHGPAYSYELYSRATIFRRDQATVVDLETFKDILRYNNYKVDPYSSGNPCNTICCRGDLQGSPDGCYDTKVTSYSLALQLRSNVINGPTTSHGLPPFDWSQFPAATHMGMPNVFNYTFEDLNPLW